MARAHLQRAYDRARAAFQAGRLKPAKVDVGVQVVRDGIVPCDGRGCALGAAVLGLRPKRLGLVGVLTTSEAGLLLGMNHDESYAFAAGFDGSVFNRSDRADVDNDACREAYAFGEALRLQFQPEEA